MARPAKRRVAGADPVVSPPDCAMGRTQISRCARCVATYVRQCSAHGLADLDWCVDTYLGLTYADVDRILHENPEP